MDGWQTNRKRNSNHVEREIVFEKSTKRIEKHNLFIISEESSTFYVRFKKRKKFLYIFDEILTRFVVAKNVLMERDHLMPQDESF